MSANWKALSRLRKNSRINTKSGRSFPSKRYSEWRRRSLILMPKIAEPIDQPVKIVASLTLPDKRKRDGNNMLASVYDLLVGLSHS